MNTKLTRAETTLLLFLTLYGSAWLAVLAVRPSWWALANSLTAYTGAITFAAALAVIRKRN